MSGEGRTEDDLSTITAIEAGPARSHSGSGTGPQSLWLRVGPVYGPDGEVETEPGIWVHYQEHHMHAPLAGPVLLTPRMWWDLVRHVTRRLQDLGPGDWLDQLAQAGLASIGDSEPAEGTTDD
jgi:hypothetical protein